MQKTRAAAYGIMITAMVALCMAGCQGVTPADTTDTTLTGSAAAGQTKFSNSCSGCHTASSIKRDAGRITTNLGSLSMAMTGITLSSQEVADLKAFLATQ